MKNQIAKLDLTIDDMNFSTNRVVELLDQKGFEERISEIYDMLLSEGHDQEIIDVVLQRLSQSDISVDEPLDESSIMFESAFA